MTSDNSRNQPLRAPAPAAACGIRRFGDRPPVRRVATLATLMRSRPATFVVGQRPQSDPGLAFCALVLGRRKSRLLYRADRLLRIEQGRVLLAARSTTIRFFTQDEYAQMHRQLRCRVSQKAFRGAPWSPSDRVATIEPRGFQSRCVPLLVFDSCLLVFARCFWLSFNRTALKSRDSATNCVRDLQVFAFDNARIDTPYDGVHDGLSARRCNGIGDRPPSKKTTAIPSPQRLLKRTISTSNGRASRKAALMRSRRRTIDGATSGAARRLMW
jgi:hypothetical protein